MTQRIDYAGPHELNIVMHDFQSTSMQRWRDTAKNLSKRRMLSHSGPRWRNSVARAVVDIEHDLSLGNASGRQASQISDKLDAHSAHTEHDPCCNDCGYDRTADHEPVGKRLADAMRHNDRTRPRREMREDEERAEPIMR
jgi:hypothetical protein